MIVHYINDLAGAAGILNDKELTLPRIGAAGGEHDVLHYLNAFNHLYYTQDLLATFKQALKLMNNTPNLNQQQFFTHTFMAAQLRKVAYQNGVSLGGSLARLLNQHSYMLPFHDKASDPFEGEALGEIALVFEENPLIAPRGFDLMFNKVHYTDEDRLQRLQAHSSDDMTTFMEGIVKETDSSFPEILAAYIEKLEKQYDAYSSVIHDLIANVTADNQDDGLMPLDMTSHALTIEFIHAFIVEEFTTTFRLETGQKPPTKLEIKQLLRQNKDMSLATWINIRGALIDNGAFKDQQEIRAILLPQNKKQFNQQKRSMSVDFDASKLRKIVINPASENKAELKAKLEDLLFTNKFSGVTVE